MMADGARGRGGPHFLRLPDELLEAVISWLPPTDTLAVERTCKQLFQITYEPLVWRRHCVQTWQYWDSRHALSEKLGLPPTQTKWRLLYNQRKKVDEMALIKFERMLRTQQSRVQEMADIAEHGYDVKDLMLKLWSETPDSASDVLARKYHAKTILGQIHRATALDKWERLSRRQMVRPEEVLGAFDLFVLSGGKGDLDDIRKELDRIAIAVKARDAEFDQMSVRKKAIQIARFLRAEGLVGNPDHATYHALRNNFIGIALFDEVHSSLPLQSVVIYCAVARRLGVSASPSNYPQHVHAVIKAPSDQTLDGSSKSHDPDDEPECMHMDPWRTTEEISQDQLRTRLSQMGAPAMAHDRHLAAATTFELVLRTGHNVMLSVQEARDARDYIGHARRSDPDLECAWYAMLWSMVMLGDPNHTTALHRRRQCLPYLVEHFQTHFPEDLNLIESHIPSMFEGEREHRIITQLIETAHVADRTRKAPSPRGPECASVKFRVGTLMKHKRYNYQGIVVGWDQKCSADSDWMQQMRVDDLSRGREQPFYNVVADDKTVRYVAEENIVPQKKDPSEAIMALAGRYFNRWDDEAGAFVSNMKEQYPDD